MNSINHKAYEGNNPIQISVYDDKIYVWNDGNVPEELYSQNLFEKHFSKPYNPLIAQTFFKAGFIESWGRGFEKIKKECQQNNVPLPEINVNKSGVMIKCMPSAIYMDLLEKLENDAKTQTKSDQVERLSSDQVEQLSSGQIKVLEFCREPKKMSEIMKMMDLKHKDSFRKRYIIPLLNSGKLEMTIPDKPHSTNQRYKSKD